MEKKDLAWERYYDLSAQELGALINMAKMGKQLHKSVPTSHVTCSTSIVPVSVMILVTNTGHHALALLLSVVPVGVCLSLLETAFAVAVSSTATRAVDCTDCHASQTLGVTLWCMCSIVSRHVLCVRSVPC